MAEYTITAVTGQKEWSNGGGITYQILLDDNKESVALNQKLTTPPPNPGDKLTGEIVPDKFGKPKFQKDYGGAYGGGSQGSWGGSGGGRGESDPDRARRIVRQHSQEMALRYFSILGEMPGIETEIFKSVIDWFDKDAMGDADSDK